MIISPQLVHFSINLVLNTVIEATIIYLIEEDVESVFDALSEVNYWNVLGGSALDVIIPKKATISIKLTADFSLCMIAEDDSFNFQKVNSCLEQGLLGMILGDVLDKITTSKKVQTIIKKLEKLNFPVPKSIRDKVNTFKPQVIERLAVIKFPYLTKRPQMMGPVNKLKPADWEAVFQVTSRVTTDKVNDKTKLVLKKPSGKSKSKLKKSKNRLVRLEKNYKPKSVGKSLPLDGKLWQHKLGIFTVGVEELNLLTRQYFGNVKGFLIFRKLANNLPRKLKGFKEVLTGLGTDKRYLDDNVELLNHLASGKFKGKIVSLKLTGDKKILAYTKESVSDKKGKLVKVPKKKKSADPNVSKPINYIVRGVTKTDFKASFSSSEDLAEQAWNLFKQKDWKSLDKLFNSNGINKSKGLSYPPNDGFISIKKSSLPKNFEFDRYGGKYIDGEFTDGGKYVAPNGASFESRALPDDFLNSPKKSYRIIKEIPNIKEGPAIPWFGKEGNGMQYKLEKSIDKLKAEGYIIEI